MKLLTTSLNSLYNYEDTNVIKYKYLQVSITKEEKGRTYLDIITKKIVSTKNYSYDLFSRNNNIRRCISLDDTMLR